MAPYHLFLLWIVLIDVVVGPKVVGPKVVEQVEVRHDHNRPNDTNPVPVPDPQGRDQTPFLKAMWQSTLEANAIDFHRNMNMEAFDQKVGEEIRKLLKKGADETAFDKMREHMTEDESNLKDGINFDSIEKCTDRQKVLFALKQCKKAERSSEFIESVTTFVGKHEGALKQVVSKMSTLERMELIIDLTKSTDKCPLVQMLTGCLDLQQLGRDFDNSNINDYRKISNTSPEFLRRLSYSDPDTFNHLMNYVDTETKEWIVKRMAREFGSATLIHLRQVVDRDIMSQEDADLWQHIGWTKASTTIEPFDHQSSVYDEKWLKKVFENGEYFLTEQTYEDFAEMKELDSECWWTASVKGATYLEPSVNEAMLKAVKACDEQDVDDDERRVAALEMWRIIASQTRDLTIGDFFNFLSVWQSYEKLPNAGPQPKVISAVVDDGLTT